MPVSAIPLIWGILFLGCVSIGNAFIRRPKRFSIFVQVWVGLAAVLVFVQGWSLFLPVDSTCLGICLGAGLLASGAWMVAARRTVRSHMPFTLRTMGPMTRVFLFLVAASAVVWVALAGTTQGSMRAYDTLLYHWNWVTWANEYPAVPGLANLHVRLGTNSAWLLLAALIDNGPMDRHVAWILPGFMPAAVTLQLLHRMVQPGPLLRISRLFALFVSPYVLRQLFSVDPGLYFDLPALLFLIVFALEVLVWTEHRRELAGLDSTKEDFSAIGWLAIPVTLSFVVKPIGAPFLACVCLVATGCLWRRGRRQRLTRGEIAAWSLPALLLVGWMARNFVLSGWVLFPAAVGGTPVDWAVPKQPMGTSHAELLHSVDGNSDVIRGWARQPYSSYHENAGQAAWREWVPIWWRANGDRLEVRRLLPATLILMGLTVGLCGWKKTKGRAWFFGFHLAWLAQAFFWFASAPDLRFADGLFWIGFAYPAALFFVLLGRAGSKVLPIAGTLALALVLLKAYEVIPLRRPPGRIWQLGTAYAMPTQVIHLGVDPAHRLAVNVPVTGDQAGDAELPSTPYPRESLRWRSPGNLRAGFRVEQNGR